MADQTDSAGPVRKTRKKSKAPQPPQPPPSKKARVQAWMLFPLSSEGSSEGVERDGDPSDQTSLGLSISPDDEETEDGSLWLSPHSRSRGFQRPPNVPWPDSCCRPGTPRVVTPRSPEEHSRCESNLTLDYSVVSLTRPPSFLYQFRKTLEVRG